MGVASKFGARALHALITLFQPPLFPNPAYATEYSCHLSTITLCKLYIERYLTSVMAVTYLGDSSMDPVMGWTKEVLNTRGHHLTQNSAVIWAIELSRGQLWHGGGGATFGHPCHDQFV